MANLKPSVVFVLGGPGSGKGTQCQKLVEKYGFIHLSAGDLLREERATGSKDAELIETLIQEGKIVPKSKFLIDGFPRSKDNLDGWNNLMGDLVDFKFVLFFDCHEDIMTKRVLKRAEGSGRSDDNIESLKKRFSTYIEQTKPIIQHYAQQNKVITINAEKSPEEVFDSLKSYFASI